MQSLTRLVPKSRNIRIKPTSSPVQFAFGFYQIVDKTFNDLPSTEPFYLILREIHVSGEQTPDGPRSLLKVEVHDLTPIQHLRINSSAKDKVANRQSVAVQPSMSSQVQQKLRLYLVESLGAARNHYALFIRLDEKNGAGQKIHVTGDVQRGTEYEVKSIGSPAEDLAYVGMKQLGWVRESDLQAIEEACRSNPPPEKQFHGPKRIYPGKPLRRCQEWTTETVQLLKDRGLLAPIVEGRTVQVA